MLMTLSANEREVVSDLIGSVRTLAAHLMAVHLQLGAVRTLLARKGTISDAEVQAAFAELNVVASAEEVLNLTSTDAVFDELLERLNRAT
jgi:ribosome-associated translation inhibitor RaiA